MHGNLTADKSRTPASVQLPQLHREPAEPVTILQDTIVPKRPSTRKSEADKDDKSQVPRFKSSGSASLSNQPPTIPTSGQDSATRRTGTGKERLTPCLRTTTRSSDELDNIHRMINASYRQARCSATVVEQENPECAPNSLICKS